MKWLNFCLNNKLIIYLVVIVMSLLGIFCLYLMPIIPFPAVQLNSMSIEIAYPGANAQTVQKQVTDKIVTGLQTLKGISQTISHTRAGLAYITLQLEANQTAELLKAQMDIMQIIASSHLPSVIPAPTIQRDEGTSGLIGFALTSNTASLFTLQNYINAVLLPRFNSLSEVVVDTSDSQPVVKVKLDPMAMAQYKLDPTVVSQILNATYQSSPLGSLIIQNRPYILNLQGDLTRLDALGKIIVGYTAETNSVLGQPIYLNNIAQLSFEPRNIAAADDFKVNGKTAADIFLLTHGNANPFSIAKEAKTFVKSLANHMPHNIKIVPVFDMSDVMKTSITEVIKTILIAGLLVLLIALIFLGRFKTTLIPIATIPVCLLGACVLIYLLGFTTNIITLLALAIAIGLVVDDAIVVVENITRYLERGLTKSQAIVQGTGDITVTIISITLTLIAVYVPIVFSSGPVAALFKPFALTLAAAVFISGVISLTLTPVMASQLLDDRPLNAYQQKFDRYLERVIAVYHRLLLNILNHQRLALSCILLLVAVGGYYAWQLPKMLFPTDPDGYITITTVGTLQEDVASMQKKLTSFDRFYQDKRIKLYSTQISKDKDSGALQSVIGLQLHSAYLKQTPALVAQINQFIKTKQLNSTHAEAHNVSNWGSGFDIKFYVYADTIHNANVAAEQISQLMKQTQTFSFVANQIDQPQKQLVFNTDHIKAASLGILPQHIAQLLSTYYGGYTLNNYFSIQGLSVPIVVSLANEDLQDPASLQKLKIQSPVTHDFYPLSHFVNLQLMAAPTNITTFNGRPAVAITANLASGHSLSDGISYINQTMQEQLPAVQYQYTGNALDYLQSNHETLFIIVLGIICVYFLLTILFNNLLDPLIILLTVPFSVIGGALALYLIKGSLNLYSAIGLITLIGLITKNGVLIVHFANQTLQKGVGVIEAVLTATRYRFRPIMMTSLAMIFGALPLVFSSDLFYMSRQNLGVALSGGLAIGTFFSLIVIPLIYVLMKKAEGEQ